MAMPEETMPAVHDSGSKDRSFAVLVNAVGVQTGGGMTQLTAFAHRAMADDGIDYTFAVSDPLPAVLPAGLNVLVPRLRGPRYLSAAVWHQVTLRRLARHFDCIFSIC